MGRRALPVSVKKANKAAYDKRYRVEHKAQKAAYQKNHPEQYRNWQYTQAYGINLEQYNKMFEAQAGCCAICGKHQSGLNRALGVEHNHDAGFVRGLVCDKCNHLVDVYEKNFYGLKQKIKLYLKG